MLEQAAELLERPSRSPEALRAATAGLEAALDELERGATASGAAVSALDPAFRARELSFVVTEVAGNVDLAAAADRRSWVDQLLGRRRAGLPGPLASAQERAGSHFERHSASLRNSVRGAVSAAGGAARRPRAVGRVVRCRAGGLHLVLLILFNIIAPEGWRIGLVRLEDVALGSAVSLAVGLMLWPRGAAAALGGALAEAYVAGARYLAGAVRFGMSLCEADPAQSRLPEAEAARAAAAARRLDNTCRGYLAERGAKPVPLAEVTSLVTGVVGLRLAGDAVIDLWQRDGGAGGDRAAARRRLLASTDAVTDWYGDFAAGRDRRPRPARRGGRAPATAVRMIWTGDHVDAARRLQAAIAGSARAAVRERALSG